MAINSYVNVYQRVYFWVDFYAVNFMDHDHDISSMAPTRSDSELSTKFHVAKSPILHG